MPYNPTVPNPHAADAPECRCGTVIPASAYYGSGLCAECADAEADVQSLLAYVEARRDLHPLDALLDACDDACRGTDYDRWLPLYSAARARLSPQATPARVPEAVTA